MLTIYKVQFLIQNWKKFIQTRKFELTHTDIRCVRQYANVMPAPMVSKRGERGRKNCIGCIGL